MDIPWTGSDRQLLSLQHKVNTYVAYACDGQLVADYAQTEGLPWRIVVTCRTGAPDARSAETLQLMEAPVSSYGGQLVVAGDLS